MTKYSVRPAVTNDAKAVDKIIARQMTLDFGGVMSSLEDLQKRWENIDLETDTLAAFTEGGLAGYAELRDGDMPFIYLADRNNVDLGFQFLKLLEQKAVTRAGRKVKLVTQISEKNQPLLQLFASNGYSSNLSFIIMDLKLEERPASPQWVEGIHVRAFIPRQDEQTTYNTDSTSCSSGSRGWS